MYSYTLTVPDTCLILNQCPSLIRTFCRTGRLVARKQGKSWMINASSVQAYKKHHFYTPENLSELLKVHPETLRRWAREGLVKATKEGQWLLDLEDCKKRARAYGKPKLRSERFKPSPEKSIKPFRGSFHKRKIAAESFI